MKAIEIREYGAPEVLQETQRPDPEPKAGEVLIRVAAAGINRPDVFQRTGNYPVPPGASDLPGLEVAGWSLVATFASRQSLRPESWRPRLRAGAGRRLRRLCTAPIEQCLPVPEGLTDIGGRCPRRSSRCGATCSIVAAWRSAWRGRNAADPGRVERHRHHGHPDRQARFKVFVTAGSDDKCKACEALGADRAINYKTQDFVAEVKALTEGKGVDVILDMVAGRISRANCRASPMTAAS
jgi:NADPH2:quinone reductase